MAYDMVSSKKSEPAEPDERERGFEVDPTGRVGREARAALLQQQPDVLEGVLHEQLHEEQRADLRGEFLDAAVEGARLPVAADLEQR